jgi:hypothetical protein
MNKKILVLLLITFIFFLTGCDAKYEMELKNSKITESISVSIPSKYTEKEINENIDYFGINSDSAYNQKIVKNDNESIISLSGKKSKISDFFNSSDSFVNKCYNKVSFVLEDGKYYIGTSKGFKCLTYEYMELDSLTINIKTYHKVYDNNADKVSNNVYTWIIDKDNISKSNILFVVSKNEYVWYYRYRYLFGGIIAISAIFLVTYIVISIFRTTSKRANKI